MSSFIESQEIFIKFDSTYSFVTDHTSYSVLNGIAGTTATKADTPKQLISISNDGVRELFFISDMTNVKVLSDDHKFLRCFSILKRPHEIEDDDDEFQNDSNVETFKRIPEEYHAIAVDTFNTIPQIFVGGFRSHVRVYDIYGKFLRKFRINDKRGDGYVNRLCVSPISRELVVSDCYNNELRIYGLDGTFHSRSQSHHFNCPVDVVFDSNGNYFVANMLSNNILVFSPDGKFLRSFGKDELNEPSAMTINDSNLVVIGCNSIVCFDITKAIE